MVDRGNHGEGERHIKETAHNTERTVVVLERIYSELRTLNERLAHMATDEQVAELQAAADALKQAVTDESVAVQAKLDALDARIAELEAGQGDQPDPRVDAIIADLKAAREVVAGLVEGGAEPTPEG